MTNHAVCPLCGDKLTTTTRKSVFWRKTPDDYWPVSHYVCHACWRDWARAQTAPAGNVSSSADVDGLPLFAAQDGAL